MVKWGPPLIGAPWPHSTSKMGPRGANFTAKDVMSYKQQLVLNFCSLSQLLVFTIIMWFFESPMSSHVTSKMLAVCESDVLLSTCIDTSAPFVLE